MTKNRVLRSCLAILAMAVAVPQAMAADAIPNLIGTWVGPNRTVNNAKGFVDWGTKTVHITEQQDRRFKGHFTYPAGTKLFYGVIYPDNKSFTWVSADSKGYNHGRILDGDKIGACYVEAGPDGLAGCAEMARTSTTPAPAPAPKN